MGRARYGRPTDLRRAARAGVLAAATLTALAPAPASACTDAGLCGVEVRPAPDRAAVSAGRLFTVCSAPAQAFASSADGRVALSSQLLHSGVLDVDLTAMPAAAQTLELTSDGRVAATLTVPARTATASPPQLAAGAPSAHVEARVAPGCGPAGFSVYLTMPAVTAGGPVGAWVVHERTGSGPGAMRGARLAGDEGTTVVIFEATPGERCYLARALDLGQGASDWSDPVCVTLTSGASPDAGAALDASGARPDAAVGVDGGGLDEGCRCHGAGASSGAGVLLLLPLLLVRRRR